MHISKEEQEHLSHAAGNAAIAQCLALLRTDKEAVMAAHWNSLSMAVRRVMVMSANLPKERADDTLNKFNALERGRINICMNRLMKEFQTGIKCMQGGSIPTPTDRDFH